MVLHQGMLPLLDGINKPFGRINFLLDEKNGFFLTFVFFRATVIFFQHIAVAFADAQIRCIFGIEGQLQFTALLINKKIRNYITFALFISPTLPPGFGFNFMI